MIWEANANYKRNQNIPGKKTERKKYKTKMQKKQTKKYDTRESWGQVYHFACLKRTSMAC